MPQFQIEGRGSLAFEGLIRGRTPEHAILHIRDSINHADIRLEETADLHGWRRIWIHERPAGRIRLHQRMRFRRD